MGMEGCQEHETSTYISGHKKAVNWLDIEQQLFYNNCPPYLHPVPVPGVYNGSMYPKCLYSDEPGVTQFKRLFFPLPGMAPKIGICSHFKEGLPKKSKHLFLILPHAGAQRGHHRYEERGHIIHDFPFCRRFWSCRVPFQTAFQELPAGMPMQRSHALHRAICALTHVHKASELTAGKVLPQQQDKQGVEITLMQSPCEDQPLCFYDGSKVIPPHSWDKCYCFHLTIWWQKLF